MDVYVNGGSVQGDGLEGHPQERYYRDMSCSLTTSGGSSSNNPKICSSSGDGEDDDDDEMGMMMDLRRGPWTVEEDQTLMSYIAKHGEGRWNSLARCAGLKRTGKSCRLRWLNYLRPDVRRGNITLEEQLLILELHSRWGNRWSKIAQYLPGRTDNEIKNYWRTRVQKHAKQLKCDVNSKQFKDTMRYLWIPRLVERIQAASNAPNGPCPAQNPHTPLNFRTNQDMIIPPALPSYICSENSTPTPASSDSFGAQVSPASDPAENYLIPDAYNNVNAHYYTNCDPQVGYPDALISPAGYYHPQCADFQNMERGNSNNNVDQWTAGSGEFSDNLWNIDDIWLLQQQHFSNNY